MVVGRVAEIWRYPIKSLQGEQLSTASIDDGIAGDRRWGIFNVETGALMSAKRYPRLLEGAARVVDDLCLLTLPETEMPIASNDPDVNAVLTEWLQTDVRLESPQPGVTAAIDIELDDGGEDPGPTTIVSFDTQPGWFYDSTSSLHLISTATLAELDRVIGPGAGDVRRFRPNIVVDTDTPFAEEQWVDETLVIGSTTMWVKKPTDRCVVITRAQPTFAASRETLKYLAKNNDRNAGISAQPDQPGSITVGDDVVLLAPDRL